MANTELTEFALRKAILGFSEGADLSFVEQQALSHVATLVKGTVGASEQAGQLSLQQEAISLAIGAIKFSYQAVSHQLKRLGHARLAFYKERKAQVATFLIPTNKEYRDLSSEQKTMNAYYRMFIGNDRMLKFLGLKVDEVKQEDKKSEGIFLSCIPYYKMSKMIPHSYSSQTPSEKVHRQIGLFFQAKVEHYLEEIDNDFDDNWKIADFFRSSWEKGNFLNNYRGPRLIIMTLANLLWNLQHPVDIKTGFALTTDEKITLLCEVQVYINQLLNAEKEPEIENFDYDGSFITYVKQVEVYVSELLNAYQEEKLHSLNLKEVTDAAHRSARILNNNVFKLIFKEDEMALKLADHIGYMNLLLRADNHILKLINESEHINYLVNVPARTIADVLIVFANLNKSQQKRLIKELASEKSSSRNCLATTLSEFRTVFLKPIYKHFHKRGATAEEKKITNWLTRKAANHILPLIGLAIEDHRVDVSVNNEVAIKNAARMRRTRFVSARDQFKEITRLAFENEKAHKLGYAWSLSTYVDIDKSIARDIDELPLKQYKIGELTELLDLIHDFISQYRSFLQYKPFKEFVLKTLSLIGKNFHELQNLISSLDEKINRDTTHNRSLIDTIKSMDQSLLGEISTFRAVVESIEDKLSAPDFEDSIREEIAHKLVGISKQFHLALPEEESGLEDFMQNFSHQPMLKMSSQSMLIRHDSFTPTVHMSAMTKAVMCCYYALSGQSKSGRKGKMLQDLLARLSSRNEISSEDAREVLLELVRITFAYRPWFFHAKYAATRSGQALKTLLLESLVNQDYPYLRLLFSEEEAVKIAGSGRPAYTLEQKLFSIKTDGLWAVSSEDLKDCQVFN